MHVAVHTFKLSNLRTNQLSNYRHTIIIRTVNALKKCDVWPKLTSSYSKYGSTICTVS